ncbi:Sulfotransferase [Operophtera brumata]|uniref:Sulfotransferase n=1 Tax=Operophtera brumata TaxID=104452 RepID=A0A0L7LHU2_OPEBR|nr:Sulfotransferase [Operophtera brumata]
MVWLLMNDLDYETSREQPLYSRFPMLEITSMIPDIGFELLKANFLNLGNFQGLGDAARCPSWKTISQAPRSSPRFIKTHLPLSMLPPNLLNTAKVVYVARDPRDVCVSYYYLQKMVGKHLIRANVPHYWETFRRDLLPWTPIVTHANEAWEQRHHPNLHFVFYEDMLKNLPKEVHRVSKFLEQDYSDIQLARLAKYLSFDSLRKNKNVNNTTSESEDGVQFIRKGEAGGWKAHFNEKMELQAEEFLTEKLQGLSLTYPSFQLHETTHL